MSPFLRTGLVTAAAALIADQVSKLWILHVLDLGRRGLIPVTSFFDLVLTWNTGISYGLFQNTGTVGQGVLLAVKVIAVVLLAVWMTRSQTRLAAAALGLIVGGAIGNAIDKVAYGAVADFVLLHAQIGGKTYSWYVFNLADAAIVAGVIGLLYDSFIGPAAAKTPR